MAKLTSLLSFHGTLDGISVYEMEGVDQPVVRRKGGAAKEKIHHDPCFAGTRRGMAEFGGRGTASRYVQNAFSPLRPGHGTTGTINKLLRAVQQLDTASPLGRRNIALSLCPELLQGLNISKRLLLDRVLHHALSCQLFKDSGTASVALPPLIPGFNILHPATHPFFKVVAVLGLMPDLFFQERLDQYGPVAGYRSLASQYVETAWQQTNIPT